MAVEELKNLIEKGSHLMETGRIAEARAYFSQVVKTDPGSAAGWYLLGAVMDDTEKKKYCFSRAAAIDPDIHAKIVRAAARPAAEIEQESLPPPLPPEDLMVEPGEESILIPVEQPKKPDAEKDTPQGKRPRSSTFYFVAILLAIVFILLVGAVLWLVLSGTIRPAPLFPTPVPARVITPTPPSSVVGQTATPSGPMNILQMPPRNKPGSTTSSGDAAENQAGIERELDQAILDNYKNNYTSAINLLDKVISASPGYADAYYERGKAYYWKAGSLQDQEEYRTALTQAISDYDRAIEIDPLAGDFYIRRAHALHDLALDADFATERRPLAEAALENMRRGMKLGSSIEFNDFNMAWIENSLGECQAALDESLKELLAGPTALDDEVYSNRAESYLCLGQYPAALDEINRAVAIKPDSIGYMFQKAKILYSLGEEDQALTILNQLIAQQSSYWGYRYYLRALILFDRGQYDQVRQDLDLGYSNTFWHGDIYMYLKAKLALLDGDRAAAVFFMQQAEASLLEDESPAIADRIRGELKDLGATQSEPLYYPRVNPTPIAVVNALPQDGLYPPHADSGKLPPGASGAVEVAYAAGSGARALTPGSQILFHFKPLAPTPVRRTTRLVIHWTPQADSRVPLEISLWSRIGEWSTFAISEADTVIDQPAFFVGDQGDLYVLVRNPDPNLAAAVKNIGIEAELITTDGRVVKFALD